MNDAASGQPPIPHPPGLEQSDVVESCGAVTKVTSQENQEIKARFNRDVLEHLGHPDLLCCTEAGHPGPHIVDVSSLDVESNIWLKWDDDAREFVTLPHCPEEIPPAPAELDGVPCLFANGHWGRHSYETDYDDRTDHWYETHEPYREEREALHRMLSSGGELGPGPGYRDPNGGYWLAGYPPTSSVS